MCLKSAHIARTGSIAGMVVGTLKCINNVKLNEDVKAKNQKKEKLAFKTLFKVERNKNSYVKYCLFLRCVVLRRRPRHAHT